MILDITDRERRLLLSGLQNLTEYWNLDPGEWQDGIPDDGEIDDLGVLLDESMDLLPETTFGPPVGPPGDIGVSWKIGKEKRSTLPPKRLDKTDLDL